MTKVEREVVFNSENGQKEMTGVRHSDDDVKKKVIDCVFKLRQLNIIPEKYVADVGYTVDDSHHIRIDIQFHDDKTLFLETGEKEGKVKKKDGK